MDKGPGHDSRFALRLLWTVDNNDSYRDTWNFAPIRVFFNYYLEKNIKM